MSDDTPDGPSLGPNESASQELGGGGEWPQPDAPSDAAAPGSDRERAELIEAGRVGGPKERSGTDSSVSQRATDQVGDVHPGQAGEARTDELDRGNAKEYGSHSNFKEVLDEDPVRGGSSTGATDDIEGKPR